MREKITEETVVAAFDKVVDKLIEKIEEKGDLSFSSRHEILGVVQEEFDEFKQTVHDNSIQETSESELIDIVIAAVWGMCSMDVGGCDW